MNPMFDAYAAYHMYLHRRVLNLIEMIRLLVLCETKKWWYNDENCKANYDLFPSS